jgi:hypothetical protein
MADGVQLLNKKNKWGCLGQEIKGGARLRDDEPRDCVGLLAGAW